MFSSFIVQFLKSTIMFNKERKERGTFIMCLLGVAMKVNDKFPFIFAANRDESKKRATANAHFWPNNPNLLAGRDLERGGTWLGISKEGKFAALTNVRQFQQINRTSSRGELIPQFFQKGERFIEGVSLNNYDGFNLLYGTVAKLTYISNRSDRSMVITNGVHALSNASINTSWPKVNMLRQEMEHIAMLTDRDELESKLFSLLSNE